MTLRRKTPMKRTSPKAKKPAERKKPLPLSEVRKRFSIVTAAMLGDPRPRKKPFKFSVRYVSEKEAGDSGLSKKERLEAFNEHYPYSVTEVLRTQAPLGRKPRKKLRPRSPSNTGWYNWAIENVWDKRPHKCEVCGKELKEPVPSAFSHLLPRGSYRKYKTDERNISLQCVRCHSLWHEVGPMMLQENRGWKAVCERYYKLRNEANCVR